MKNRHLKKIFFGSIFLLAIPAVNIVFIALLPGLYTMLYIMPAASVLAIIAMRERAELKLSYIAACMIFPVTSPLLLLRVVYLTKRSQRKMSVAEYSLPPLSRDIPMTVRGAIEIALSLDPDASLIYDFEADYYPTGAMMAEDILNDIAQAAELVYLEYYIVGDGAFLDRLLDALSKAVSRGVRVCFIYDDLGSVLGVPHDFSLRLAKMGIFAVPFSPISSSAWKTNCRDHKKLLIIDGRVVYTGGINISDEYIGGKSRLGIWKDSGIRIRSASPLSVTEGFEKMLAEVHGDDITSDSRAKVLPRKRRAQKSACLFFSSYPARLYGTSVAREVICHLFSAATEKVALVTPYFIPDAELFNLVLRAARRGISIDIIIPGIPDKRIVRLIAEGFFEELINVGVSIYEYTPGFLHSKLLLVDGAVALVGSINFDQRSMYQNYECAALVYNSPVLSEINKDIENILSESRRINIADENPSAIKKAVRRVFRAALPIL